MNKRIIASVLLVTVLFASVIALIIFCYNAQIIKPNTEKTPTLETSLGIVEIQGKNSNFVGKPAPIPYNYLYITGTVNNTYQNTIYNCGLHVAAYDLDNRPIVNITVPLAIRGIFGSDSATNDFVSKNYDASYINREVLDAHNAYYITISILHGGIVTSWTITPVWTNTP